MYYMEATYRTYYNFAKINSNDGLQIINMSHLMLLLIMLETTIFNKNNGIATKHKIKKLYQLTNKL